MTDYQIKTRAVILASLSAAVFLYVAVALVVLKLLHPVPPPCREVLGQNLGACSVPATQRVILFPANEEGS